MNNLKYSEIESKRFNKKIYRGMFDELDIHAFEEFYVNNDPDVLIFRIPVAEQCKMYQLNTLNKEVINADTLVSYEVELKNTVYNPIKNDDIVFVKSNSPDIYKLLIPEIFNNYTNHYFSNPVLDKKKYAQAI